MSQIGLANRISDFVWGDQSEALEPARRMMRDGGVGRDAVGDWEAGHFPTVYLPAVKQVLDITEKEIADALQAPAIPADSSASGQTRGNLGETDNGKLPPREFGKIANLQGFVGRRDVMRRLATFLKQSGSSVYTFHGLGGCGKSATILYFLQSRGFLGSPPTRKSPDALFVWSFFVDNNLDTFFSELIRYLSPLLHGDERARPNSYNPLLLADDLGQSDRSIVIVLDGLERVQDTKQADDAWEGSINSPALRSLLQRVAENRCGSTKIIVTTRVLIPEMREDNGSSIRVDDMNILPEKDCLEILRNNGVKGAATELNKAIGEYNNHAYSIALLGKLLSTYLQGDVRRRDRIGKLGRKGNFEQILSWYKERLRPDLLVTLMGISVFREPVSVADLHELLPRLRADADNTLKAPHQSSMTQTIAAIHDLSELGLVFLGGGDVQRYCDLHPRVRDYFYPSILNPREAHARAWDIFFPRRPMDRPSTAVEIELLVELIYHGVMAGHAPDAWEIYRSKLGYKFLGWKRAEHPTGAKIVFTFLDQRAPEELGLDDGQLSRLYIDGSLYLKNEGRLEDAIELLQTGISRFPGITGQSIEHVSLILNLSGVELLRGRTTDAAQTARKAQQAFTTLTLATKPPDRRRLEKECQSRLASALAFAGDPRAADLFEQLQKIPDSKDAEPNEYAAINYAWLLTQQGKHDRAREVVKDSIVLAEGFGSSMIVDRLKAQLTFVEIATGPLDEAEDLVDTITKSAALRVDLHLFIQSWIMRSSLALALNDLPDAQKFAVEGLRHAGENGFNLCWLDLRILLARIAVHQKDWSAAAESARLALGGDETSFVYPMLGAVDHAVNYAWAASAAKYISGAIQLRNKRTKAEGAALTALGRTQMQALQQAILKD